MIITFCFWRIRQKHLHRRPEKRIKRMCLAIAFKGNDLLYGFNFDVDPAVWQYSVHKTKNLFAVGITVGKTTYYVHGVNKNGSFGNTPYMNGENLPAPKGTRRERIDLMNDRYIRGRYAFSDIEDILRTKAVVNIPAATMHSLIGSGAGEMYVVEPGYGSKKVEDNFAVLSNFPVLTELPNYDNPFYGKDRYDKAVSDLSRAPATFSAEDALRLLHDAKQEGKWGTRVSFVWSRNRNTVYYFLDGDSSCVEMHRFE